MKILSMFQEADVGGNPGQVSMRRVLAFLMALIAIGLFVGGFFIEKESRYVFIPGIVTITDTLLRI